MRTHTILFVPAFLIVSLLAARASAAPCADVFDQLYPETGAQKVRFVKGEAENDISYGLEAEFNVQNAPGILDWYRPSSQTDDQWFAMTVDQRKAAVTTGSGMVKTSRAPAWLHESLSSDPGGAELMTKVTNKLEEALSWVRQVELQGGGDAGLRSKAFYWQGNVAYKHTGAFTRENRDGLEGYIRATGDYAQFAKLYNGYEFHQQKASYIPAANLGHGVLGPLNTQKMADMQRELESSANGQNLTGYSHYIQGTYFRTWPYGPGRSGMEIRDAHKDVFVLRRELRRITHGLENGFGAYAGFKGISVLDETAHFNLLSQAVRNMLSSFPSSYSGPERWSNSPGRFAFAMKPFENEYPQALGLQGADAEQFKTRVINARTAYVQTLETLAADSSLTPAQKLEKSRIAIAKFAYDSGMYAALDTAFAKIGTPR
jgi:hypothetical protein